MVITLRVTPRPGGAHDPEFGRDERSVTPAGKCAPNEFFVLIRSVHISRVEQRHAELERAMDGANRLSVIGRTIEL